MPLERNFLNIKSLPQFQINLDNYCGGTYKGSDDVKYRISQILNPIPMLAAKRPKRPTRPMYEMVVSIGDGTDVDMVK